MKKISIEFNLPLQLEGNVYIEILKAFTEYFYQLYNNQIKAGLKMTEGYTESNYFKASNNIEIWNKRQIKDTPNLHKLTNILTMHPNDLEAMEEEFTEDEEYQPYHKLKVDLANCGVSLHRFEQKLRTKAQQCYESLTSESENLQAHDYASKIVERNLSSQDVFTLLFDTEKKYGKEKLPREMVYVLAGYYLTTIDKK